MFIRELVTILQDSGVLLTLEEKQSLLEERVSSGKDLNGKFVINSVNCQETSENNQMLNSTPRTKENELALKRLAKSVFELQQPDNFIDFASPSLSISSEASVTRSLPNVIKILPISLLLLSVFTLSLLT